MNTNSFSAFPIISYTERSKHQATQNGRERPPSRTPKVATSIRHCRGGSALSLQPTSSFHVVRCRKLPAPSSPLGQLAPEWSRCLLAGVGSDWLVLLPGLKPQSMEPGELACCAQYPGPRRALSESTTTSGLSSFGQHPRQSPTHLRRLAVARCCPRFLCCWTVS